MIMTVKCCMASKECNLLVVMTNCLHKIVVASEAIVICLLLSWRDSFSKLSV